MFLIEKELDFDFEGRIWHAGRSLPTIELDSCFK